MFRCIVLHDTCNGQSFIDSPQQLGEGRSRGNFSQCCTAFIALHVHPAVILQRRAVISRIFEAITHRAQKALINQATLALTTEEFIVWRVQTLNHD